MDETLSPQQRSRFIELCEDIALKSEQLSFRPGFRVSVGNPGSQAAVMVLKPGGREGGSDNRHVGAAQWLFVVEGSGTAIINGHKMQLKPGRIRAR